MKLPNAVYAQVERAKVADYLLDPNHPDGGSKADFFSRFGDTRKRWEVLADALREHALAHEVVMVVASAHGARYQIDGEMDAPDGRKPRIRSVWIIDIKPSNELEKGTPRLITAYPI